MFQFSGFYCRKDPHTGSNNLAPQSAGSKIGPGVLPLGSAQDRGWQRQDVDNK